MPSRIRVTLPLQMALKYRNMPIPIELWDWPNDIVCEMEHLLSCIPGIETDMASEAALAEKLREQAHGGQQ